MKLSSKAAIAAAVFCLAACTPDPGDKPEPIADAGDANAGANSTQSANEGEGTSASTPGTANNGLASRMRLPDMEKLPSDRELASKENPNKGGGVIARPPSE